MPGPQPQRTVTGAEAFYHELRDFSLVEAVQATVAIPLSSTV